MTKGHLAVSALALAFASSLLAFPTLAQNPPNASKPAATAATPVKPDAQPLLKFSQDGNNAIREINGARLAIFEGNPTLASQLISKAKTSVTKAAQEAPTFKVRITTSVRGKELGTTSETDKAELVPVDGRLVLADDFVSTPEKQSRIKKANEHFKSGKNTEALEELRLGEIDVMYNRVWMPIVSASKHIDQAMKLMEDQKYYEANLALKAIGDSLTFDSIKLTEVPKAKS